MVNQIFLTLAIQITFFVFFYYFRNNVSKNIGRDVCAICFSAASTWITLLLLKYFAIYQFNAALIAILLAESVVGISYLVEQSKTVLKFTLLIYGTLSVSIFAFINETFGLLLFAPVVIYGFLALPNTLKPNNVKNKTSHVLKEKLKNCC